MKTYIKIYGERNTNTNYLSKLIELNIETPELRGVAPHPLVWLQRIIPGNELLRDLYFDMTFENNLGWKHTKALPPEEFKRYNLLKKNRILFVTLTKNPYSWALSLYRNPYHQPHTKNLDFETFLKTPWKPVKRDNLHANLNSPIELWNIKNSSYLALREINALNLRSEDIITKPETVISRICSHFGINKKMDSFVNYEKSTKEKTKNSNFYKNYYSNELWKEKISKTAIETINEYIDKKIMSEFEYDILS